MSWWAALAEGATQLYKGYSGRKAESKDRRFQRQFAKNQIQWRVEDAKKAGLHPLAALGAPTVSPAVSAGDPMGDAVGQMGRNIADYVERRADRKREGQMRAERNVLTHAQVQEADARAALLRAQKRKVDADTVTQMKLASDAALGRHDKQSNNDVRFLEDQHGQRVGPIRGSSAEDAGQEYGEIFGEGYGLWKLLQMMYDESANARRMFKFFQHHNQRNMKPLRR